MIKEAVLRWARAREPDFIIGGRERPYLRRHFLIPRNVFLNIYVHEFRRSDDDRALHDHPWLFNASFILAGRYLEWAFERDYWFTHAHSETTTRHLRGTGDWKFRWGKAPHRVELTDGPCWSLFITGPRIREWGFYCPTGWIHWKRFTASDDKGAIGAGCDA